jgi:hypothetical protein
MNLEYEEQASITRKALTVQFLAQDMDGLFR